MIEIHDFVNTHPLGSGVVVSDKGLQRIDGQWMREVHLRGPNAEGLAQAHPDQDILADIDRVLRAMAE